MKYSARIQDGLSYTVKPECLLARPWRKRMQKWLTNKQKSLSWFGETVLKNRGIKDVEEHVNISA